MSFDRSMPATLASSTCPPSSAVGLRRWERHKGNRRVNDSIDDFFSDGLTFSCNCKPPEASVGSTRRRNDMFELSTHRVYRVHQPRSQTLMYRITLSGRSRVRFAVKEPKLELYLRHWANSMCFRPWGQSSSEKAWKLRPHSANRCSSSLISIWHPLGIW